MLQFSPASLFLMSLSTLVVEAAHAADSARVGSPFPDSRSVNVSSSIAVPQGRGALLLDLRSGVLQIPAREAADTQRRRSYAEPRASDAGGSAKAVSAGVGRGGDGSMSKR